MISLWVIYHVGTTLLVPNGYSIIGHALGPYILGYTNSLGQTTAWQFFSPNPVTERYIEYELTGDDEGLDYEPHYWPPKISDEILSENYSRRLSHSFLVTTTNESVQTYLVPWLCRLHPNATGVSLRAISMSVQSIESARFSQENDFKGLSQQVEVPSQHHYCPNGESQI